jgi:hypothetical protein
MYRSEHRQDRSQETLQMKMEVASLRFPEEVQLISASSYAASERSASAPKVTLEPALKEDVVSLAS